MDMDAGKLKEFKKIEEANDAIKAVDKNLENQIISLNRQFLHAEILGFVHPGNNKEVEFSSFLPHELEIILEMLFFVYMIYHVSL